MQEFARQPQRRPSHEIVEPFRVSEMSAFEIAAALEASVSEELIPKVMEFLKSRRESWAAGSDRKHKNLLQRRRNAAKHYIQIAIGEIATRTARGASPVTFRFISMKADGTCVLMQEPLRRYVMLATRAVIRQESRQLDRFLRACVLYHDGPLQGYIKAYLRRKNMLGGDESLENRVLRLKNLTFDTLEDRCTEPRLAYLFWARRSGFDADSGMAYEYIKTTARNLLNQATRDALGPKPRPQNAKKVLVKQPPKKKKESAPYKALEAIGSFFERSPALREAMPKPDSPLVLTDEDYDAEPLCSRFSERVFEEHFAAGKKGMPDVTWGVFWARVIQGMPREEAASYFRCDVARIRKRESLLRVTIIKFIDEILTSKDE